MSYIIAMYNLPTHSKLTIAPLVAIFNKTTASYKYFWFLSILQKYSHKRQKLISFEDIVYHMLANAWYIVHYFHLSFGNCDILYETIIQLANKYKLPINQDSNTLVKLLKQNLSSNDKKALCYKLTKYVPYHFLSPWLKNMNRKDIILASQNFEHDCLYSIEKQADAYYINLNQKWCDYLLDNYKILQDFCYWNLCLYLQARNPNVPNIANKLIRPVNRQSLKHQKDFWNLYLKHYGSIKCIYTEKIITQDYELDHFIPWSFVAHNLNWNLIPADPNINSSKNNKLPNLDKYLKSLVKLQHQAIQVVYECDPKNKILEDYRSLNENITAIVRMNNADFYALYYKNMLPLFQIAQNQGFSVWDN